MQRVDIKSRYLLIFPERGRFFFDSIYSVYVYGFVRLHKIPTAVGFPRKCFHKSDPRFVFIRCLWTSISNKIFEFILTHI